ncbi:MAG TPA: glycosyltransferase [Longimicrobiales bacterium]
MAIPHILHQTWKDHDVPERFRESVESWRRHHPDWEYRFWTDDDLEALVAADYPGVLDLFRAYREPIQRVDAARYMILHRFGGVYSDLDIVCVRPITPLAEHVVVLPDTAPAGVSNDLMMAEAGHPFFQELVDGLGAAAARWDRRVVPRHFRVLLSTGSLYVTGALRRTRWRGDVTVLGAEEYRSQDPAKAYVLHRPGDTWAGWDTRALTWLHRHWGWVVGVAALVALGVLAVALG